MSWRSFICEIISYLLFSFKLIDLGNEGRFPLGENFSCGELLMIAFIQLRPNCVRVQKRTSNLTSKYTIQYGWLFNTVTGFKNGIRVQLPKLNYNFPIIKNPFMRDYDQAHQRICMCCIFMTFLCRPSTENFRAKIWDMDMARRVKLS